MESPSSYLIIGAGCFGASTALHLKRESPSAKVTLVDRTPFPCPSAAAHDLNKIIRAEYEDPFYMKLALEAQELWINDPIFSPYYHQTGILFATNMRKGTNLVNCYKSLTGDSPAELLDPEVAKGKFEGVFRNADLSQVETCLWNPEAGWGDAENALRNVIQSAIELGVEYVADTVTRLSFDDTTGACSGAFVACGSNLKADKTILCTGASTAKLLADSAPDRSALQVNGRMVAAAAVMCLYRVPENQMAKFQKAPIVVNAEGSIPGESIPPGPDRLVKCTHELSFTNKAYHALLKDEISGPPEDLSRSTWSPDVPQGLKDETQLVRKKLYGDWIEGLQPEHYRMCWDAVTPNQDFIISPHPDSQNLYVVGGGSFHGWKFMTNIGSYVVQMLRGKLEPSTAERWGWDRNNDGAACGVYLPSRDLEDIPVGPST